MTTWTNITRQSSSRRRQPGCWRIGDEEGSHVTIVRENLNCQYKGDYDIRITTRRKVVEIGSHMGGPGGTHSVAVVQGCQTAKRIAERLYAALVNTEAPEHQGESHGLSL